MTPENIHIAWKEEAASCSHCIHCDGVLLTSNNGIVRLWKEYFYPADIPSIEQAESGDEEDDSPIIYRAVTETVKARTTVDILTS